MPQNAVTARPMVRGRVSGPAFVCRKAFSFLGDVDMDTGVIIARGHEHEGETIAGKSHDLPRNEGLLRRLRRADRPGQAGQAAGRDRALQTGRPEHRRGAPSSPASRLSANRPRI